MNVLIIKLGALGDVINATSVVKQIINHHKEGVVHLLTTPAYKAIFLDFDKLNVTTFERKGFFNGFKTITWIRKQRFDRVYDLQSNDRTAFFCALSKAPFRAGNHPRYPYHTYPENTYIGQCHAFERLNQIIMSAGIAPAQPLPFLPSSNATKSKVSGWLDKNNLLKKPFVILHAGSSPLHQNKRWPYFIELAKKLSGALNIVWVGGDDDREINKRLSKNIGVDATNAFSIFELAELGKKARFAVTNDSAPMHVLSCSGIPIFGLFGPTYPRRTHALGQLHNVISPNHIIAENDHGFIPADITNISLNAVLEKLKAQKLI